MERPMTQEYDLVIRGGTIVDGTGKPPVTGDIAVSKGIIQAVGLVPGKGKEEIDAKGLHVMPGFVDIHTHYDGQAIWSDRLNPSSQHGVTTVVVGNCGVGFAPCRREDHDVLVHMMEGVEDIPGVVMTEGLTWDWETFPQFLDAIEKRPHDIDIAAYLPHSPLRVYVMGKRGADRHTATPDDLERMRALTREAIAAGALGFSTSRATAHRSADGSHIPSFEVAMDELVAIGSAMKDAGGGLLQASPDFPEEPDSAKMEAMMIDAAQRAGVPLSITTGVRNSGPVRWDKVAKVMEKAQAEGTPIYGQILPRPVGVIIGLQHTLHPFAIKPSYAPLAKLTLAEKVKAMRDPEVRKRLLSEEPDSNHPVRLMARHLQWIYPLDAIPNYEPGMNDSVAAKAAAMGVPAEEAMYDMLLEDEGRKSFMLSLGNLHDGSLDEMALMMEHKQMVIGLGDGGAHYGMICDSSYPTFMLTHWTRKRAGKKFPLEKIVRMMSAETAQSVGLFDRGILAPGYKADVNIINYDGLELPAPQVVHDLPGGGQRLDQKARGYVMTIVSGQVIARDGQPTSARPGRLVRGRQPAPKVA